MSTNEVLQLIFSARGKAHEGDFQTARQLAQEAISKEPKNHEAWWLLAEVTQSDAERRQAMNQVLNLRPGHPGAMLLQREYEVGNSSGTSRRQADIKARASLWGSESQFVQRSERPDSLRNRVQQASTAQSLAAMVANASSASNSGVSVGGETQDGMQALRTRPVNYFGTALFIMLAYIFFPSFAPILNGIIVFGFFTAVMMGRPRYNTGCLWIASAFGLAILAGLPVIEVLTEIVIDIAAEFDIDLPRIIRELDLPNISIPTRR